MPPPLYPPADASVSHQLMPLPLLVGPDEADDWHAEGLCPCGSCVDQDVRICALLRFQLQRRYVTATRLKPIARAASQTVAATVTIRCTSRACVSSRCYPPADAGPLFRSPWESIGGRALVGVLVALLSLPATVFLDILFWRVQRLRHQAAIIGFAPEIKLIARAAIHVAIDHTEAQTALHRWLVACETIRIEILQMRLTSVRRGVIMLERAKSIRRRLNSSPVAASLVDRPQAGLERTEVAVERALLTPADRAARVVQAAFWTHKARKAFMALPGRQQELRRRMAHPDEPYQDGGAICSSAHQCSSVLGANGSVLRAPPRHVWFRQQSPFRCQRAQRQSATVTLGGHALRRSLETGQRAVACAAHRSWAAAESAMRRVSSEVSSNQEASSHSSEDLPVKLGREAAQMTTDMALVFADATAAEAAFCAWRDAAALIRRTARLPASFHTPTDFAKARPLPRVNRPRRSPPEATAHSFYREGSRSFYREGSQLPTAEALPPVAQYSRSTPLHAAPSKIVTSCHERTCTPWHQKHCTVPMAPAVNRGDLSALHAASSRCVAAPPTDVAGRSKGSSVSQEASTTCSVTWASASCSGGAGKRQRKRSCCEGEREHSEFPGRESCRLVGRQSTPVVQSARPKLLAPQRAQTQRLSILSSEATGSSQASSHVPICTSSRLTRTVSRLTRSVSTPAMRAVTPPRVTKATFSKRRPNRLHETEANLLARSAAQMAAAQLRPSPAEPVLRAKDPNTLAHSIARARSELRLTECLVEVSFKSLSTARVEFLTAREPMKRMRHGCQLLAWSYKYQRALCTLSERRGGAGVSAICAWSLALFLIFACSILTLLIGTQYIPSEKVGAWLQAISISLGCSWLVLDPIIIMARSEIAYTRARIRTTRYQCCEKVCTGPVKSWCDALTGCLTA